MGRLRELRSHAGGGEVILNIALSITVVLMIAYILKACADTEGWGCAFALLFMILVCCALSIGTAIALGSYFSCEWCK